MRRRLDLAASLVGQPEVLFLDEPSTGLDPRSRQAMWELVAELARSGVTVFLTTQYLEEADVLADSIALLDHGRLVAEGTPAELKRRIGDSRLVLSVAGELAFLALADALGARALASDAAALTLSVATDGTAAHVRALLDEVDPGRDAIAHFDVHGATLDDVFLALTTTAKEPARV
jgi:ABC-2 type transport system ATP-binding protein